MILDYSHIGLKLFSNMHSFAYSQKKIMNYLSLQIEISQYLLKTKLDENKNASSEIIWTHCKTTQSLTKKVLGRYKNLQNLFHFVVFLNFRAKFLKQITGVQVLISF